MPNGVTGQSLSNGQDPKQKEQRPLLPNQTGKYQNTKIDGIHEP